MTRQGRCTLNDISAGIVARQSFQSPPDDVKLSCEVGTLNDTSNVSPDVEVWCENKQSWVIMPEPKFQKSANSSRLVPTKRSIMNVVSLVPSVTETLSAWGVTPIACTKYCERPDLHHVGGTKNPEIEAIVALNPISLSLTSKKPTRGLRR